MQIQRHQTRPERVSALWKEITVSSGRGGGTSEFLSRSLNAANSKAELGVTRLLRGIGIVGTEAGEAACGHSLTLIDILRRLDHEIEFAPYADTLLSDRLECALFDSDGDPAISAVLSEIRCCTKEDVISFIPKLPVLPVYALQVLQELQRDEVSIKRLVSIASRDQVLAGALMQCANSAAYGAVRNVTNLEYAVAYIGTDRACSIVTALTMKPLIVAGGASELWTHALESAAAAEALGTLCHIPKADAFLLGLMHDIGRLLLTLVPSKAKAVHDRLLRGGCERAVAELLVYGIDHAAAGYHVLEHWNLPWAHADALRFHHEPQLTDSKLAALLYLVEFWTASEEDPPSTARLNAALGRVGLTLDALMALRLETGPHVRECSSFSC